MTPSRHYCILLLLAVACTPKVSEKPDLAQFKSQDRIALALAGANVYAGADGVTKGTPLTALKSNTIVYLTNDSLAVNDLKFREVTLGDSSGYIASNLIFPKNSLGVLNGALLAPVNIFNDGTTISASGVNFVEWSLVPVLESTRYSTQVVYAKDQLPTTGYVERQSVTANGLDLDFFLAHHSAAEIMAKRPGAMDSLRSDPKFNMLWSHKKIFGQEVENGVYTSFADLSWADSLGNGAQAPASVGLYLIFANGTQSTVNNLGGELIFNGSLGSREEEKDVKMFRVVLIPKLATGYTLAISFFGAGDEGPKQADSIYYPEAVPGKTYSYVFFDSQALYCKKIIIEVTTDTWLKAMSTIEAECGE